MFEIGETQERICSEEHVELIGCIAGRGFKVRREDMKKLLLSTREKVFTLQTLSHLIECTRLGEFRTQTEPGFIQKGTLIAKRR